jgi:REP element-mobilizing transposase RayT
MIKYSQQYRVTIASYCLMPNHYHIIAKQQPSGSLPSFLKTTFSAYTQAINKRFGTSGTLFQGQAKIKEITTDSYCLQVIRYVHLNPVTAKMVTSAGKWKYSNYHKWINHGEDDLIDKELRDTYFANAKEYRQFVEEYQIEQQNNDLEKFLFKEE